LKHKIIPIFIPHLGCLDSCIYCDQKKITGFDEEISPGEIQGKIETCLSHIISHYPSIAPQNIQIAFYGGNFTGLDLSLQESFLQIVGKYVEGGLVDSIRVSTRPDYLDQQELSFLKEGYVKTIEMGVQSLDEKVLSVSGRSYLPGDVWESFQRLRRNRFQVGVQMMLGLPGETVSSARSTVKKIIEWKPDFVRVYPTLVIRGTGLEKLYREGSYCPLSLRETVGLCKAFLVNFEVNDIPVIRLGLHPSESLLERIVDGPFHPALKYMIKSEIAYDLVSLLMKRHGSLSFERGVFYIPEGSLSEFKGMKSENIRRFKRDFGLENFSFVEESDVGPKKLRAVLDRKEIEVSRKDLLSEACYQL